MLGGHGGVLSFDAKGAAQYYEYGRYNPRASGIIGVRLTTEEGNVRRVKVPNIDMDKDGKPIPASMEALKNTLSKKAGHNTRVELTCDSNADEKRVSAYAESVANDANRRKYSWNPFNPNQCRSFAKRAIDAGR
jgi:hypothetical protein